MNVKVGVVVFLLLVFAGCTRKSEESAPRIDSTLHPQRSLTVDSFRFVQSGTTMQQIKSKIGDPDREAGSGIYIYEYRLQDGSTVRVGSPDGSKVLYVRHGNEVLVGK